MISLLVPEILSWAHWAFFASAEELGILVVGYTAHCAVHSAQFLLSFTMYRLEFHFE